MTWSGLEGSERYTMKRIKHYSLIQLVTYQVPTCLLARYNGKRTENGFICLRMTEKKKLREKELAKLTMVKLPIGCALLLDFVWLILYV
jgi:hypothetical protein